MTDTVFVAAISGAAVVLSASIPAWFAWRKFTREQAQKSIDIFAGERELLTAERTLIVTERAALVAQLRMEMKRLHEEVERYHKLTNEVRRELDVCIRERTDSQQQTFRLEGKVAGLERKLSDLLRIQGRRADDHP